jgi:hypothetical protein
MAFPGSKSSLESSQSILQTLFHDRMDLYHRLCAVPSTNISIRDVIDVFYDQEIVYGKFLAGQPELLQKLCHIGSST